MLSRGMLEHAVEHAGPAEPGDHRKPPRHRGGPEPAELLHPPDIQLQIRAAHGQRIQAALSTPGEITTQVGFGVLTGRTLEPAQVGSGCQPYTIGPRVTGGGEGGWLAEVHHSPTFRPAGEHAKWS